MNAVADYEVMIEISSLFLFFVFCFWCGDSKRFLMHLILMLSSGLKMTICDFYASYRTIGFSVVQSSVLLSSHLIFCPITVHVVRFQVALIMTIT